MLVVLTWGAAGAVLTSVYDKPESQSQDGPQCGQHHKDPQSWTEHHHRVDLGSAFCGFQLDHNWQSWLWGEQRNELPQQKKTICILNSCKNQKIFDRIWAQY